MAFSKQTSSRSPYLTSTPQAKEAWEREGRAKGIPPCL